MTTNHFPARTSITAVSGGDGGGSCGVGNGGGEIGERTPRAGGSASGAFRAAWEPIEPTAKGRQMLDGAGMMMNGLHGLNGVSGQNGLHGGLQALHQHQQPALGGHVAERENGLLLPGAADRLSVITSASASDAAREAGRGGGGSANENENSKSKHNINGNCSRSATCANNAGTAQSMSDSGDNRNASWQPAPVRPGLAAAGKEGDTPPSTRSSTGSITTIATIATTATLSATAEALPPPRTPGLRTGILSSTSASRPSMAPISPLSSPKSSTSFHVPIINHHINTPNHHPVSDPDRARPSARVAQAHQLAHPKAYAQTHNVNHSNHSLPPPFAESPRQNHQHLDPQQLPHQSHQHQHQIQFQPQPQQERQQQPQRQPQRQQPWTSPLTPRRGVPALFSQFSFHQQQQQHQHQHQQAQQEPQQSFAADYWAPAAIGSAYSALDSSMTSAGPAGTGTSWGAGAGAGPPDGHLVPARPSGMSMPMSMQPPPPYSSQLKRRASVAVDGSGSGDGNGLYSSGGSMRGGGRAPVPPPLLLPPQPPPPPSSSPVSGGRLSSVSPTTSTHTTSATTSAYVSAQAQAAAQGHAGHVPGSGPLFASLTSAPPLGRRSGWSGSGSGSSSSGAQISPSPTGTASSGLPYQHPTPKHTRSISISNTNLSSTAPATAATAAATQTAQLGGAGADGSSNCNMTTIQAAAGLAPGLPASTMSSASSPRQQQSADNGNGSGSSGSHPQLPLHHQQQQQQQLHHHQAPTPFPPAVVYYMDTAAAPAPPSSSAQDTASASAGALQAPSHAAAGHILDIAPLPESIEASIMGSSTCLLTNSSSSGGDPTTSYSPHNYSSSFSSSSSPNNANPANNNHHHPQHIPIAGPTSASAHQLSSTPSSTISAPHSFNPAIPNPPFPPLTNTGAPTPDPLAQGSSQDFGGWRLAVDPTPFTSGLEGISGLPLEVYHATSAIGGAPPPPSLDMNRDAGSWGAVPIYEEEVKLLDTYLAELISLMEPFALTPTNPFPPPPPPYLHTRLARLGTLVRETLASLESRSQPRLDSAFSLPPPGDAKASEAEREMLMIRRRRLELQEKAAASKRDLAPMVRPRPPAMAAQPYRLDRAPLAARPMRDAWRCVGCGTTHTNVWCDGPDGPRSLCESCGDHYDRLVRKRDGGDGDFSAVPQNPNGMIGLGP